MILRQISSNGKVRKEMTAEEKALEVLLKFDGLDKLESIFGYKHIHPEYEGICRHHRRLSSGCDKPVRYILFGNSKRDGKMLTSCCEEHLKNYMDERNLGFWSIYFDFGRR